MEEYKQKAHNTNYYENLLEFQLSKDDWFWCKCWLQCLPSNNIEHLSQDSVYDLLNIFVNPIDRTGVIDYNEYDEDELLIIKIPRCLLRIFVYGIGQIAYCFDTNPPTPIIARDILNKIHYQIEQQLPNDDKWFEYNY